MIAEALDHLPIVAILRGVKPDEVRGIGSALYENGVRCIEVPLNSPEPFASIENLAAEMPTDCLVGAGTVLSAADVKRVGSAGGKLVVTPNTFDEVITTALGEGMQVVPGFASPTDAFCAVRAGATFLKLFPASTFGVKYLRSLAAVLPSEVRVLAVGGIGPKDFGAWRAAGAVGFGIGSELYKPGDTAAIVGAKAAAMRRAMG